MYSILAPILFLIGLAGIIFIIARALPVVSSIPEPENFKMNFPLVNKVREVIRKIPWQKWLFRGIEMALKRVRFVLFAGLKKSEKLAQSAQVRSNKLTPANGVAGLPKFFERIHKRRAFLEEERKLLEYIAHHHDDVSAYKRLGNLYAIAGNVKDARAALEQALHLSPDDIEIMQRLEDLN